MPHPTELDPTHKGEVIPLLQQPRAIVTRASDITPKATHWLWPGWLAAGKLHLLAGPPGTGKTTIAAGWAAIVSCGGLWPDGSRAEAGDVLLWSGEDGNDDVLNPRLRAAGAAMDRVHTIDGMLEGPHGRRPFDPASDMHALASVLVQRTIRLLIIDPVVAVVAGDSHKNAEVRRGLQPLVDLAVDYGVAILGITHLSKGTAGRDPLERITGSLAFGAVTRLAFVTCVDPADEDDVPTRRIVRVKSNLGPDGGGFSYTIGQRELDGYPDITSSLIQWGETLVGDARSLLGANADSSIMKPLESATRFLLGAMASGPVPVSILKELAAEAGVTWRTVERAKAELKLRARKAGMDGGWSWALPDNQS